MAVDPISKAALRLKQSNPEAFDEYVHAIEQLTHGTLVKVAETPADAAPATIFVRQGHAQQLSKLLRLLKECHIGPSR